MHKCVPSVFFVCDHIQSRLPISKAKPKLTLYNDTSTAENSIIYMVPLNKETTHCENVFASL